MQTSLWIKYCFVKHCLLLNRVTIVINVAKKTQFEAKLGWNISFCIMKFAKRNVVTSYSNEDNNYEWERLVVRK